MNAPAKLRDEEECKACLAVQEVFDRTSVCEYKTLRGLLLQYCL